MIVHKSMGKSGTFADLEFQALFKVCLIFFCFKYYFVKQFQLNYQSISLFKF